MEILALIYMWVDNILRFVLVVLLCLVCIKYLRKK